MDEVRHRRPELVHVRRLRAVPRGRHRVRALRRLRRQVRRAEGEARLHDPGRVAGLPVQAGLGRGQVTDVPVRGHRRGVRAGLRRVDPVRAGSVRPARAPVADRHPAAEDPRHRAVRVRGGLRRQPDRQPLAAADADDRGVPGAPDRASASPSRSRSATSSPRLGADMPGSWTRPADVRASLQEEWESGDAAGALRGRRRTGRRSVVPIRGPSAREIGERLAEVRQWAAEWAAAAGGPLRVEYKQVGGRHFGANSIPARAWLRQLRRRLGVAAGGRRGAPPDRADRGGRAAPGWSRG